MKQNKDNTTQQHPMADDPPEGSKQAFACVRPMAEAIDEKEVIKVDTNATKAAIIVVSALKAVRKLRPQMERLLDFDIANLDRLEDLALATWYADSIAWKQDPESLVPLATEGSELRKLLHDSAEILSRFGLMPAKQVAEISRSVGYVDLGNDLLALSRLYAGHWEEVEDATPVSEVEVDRAEALGDQLLRALAERDEETADEAMQMRARVYTLLDRAYAQVRRAAAYLRFDQRDAKRFAPTMRPRRGPRSRHRLAKSDAASAAPPSQPEGAATTVAATETPAVEDAG